MKRATILVGFLWREMWRDRVVWGASVLLALSLLAATLAGLERLAAQRSGLAEADRHAASSLDELRTKGEAIRRGTVEMPSYWNNPADPRGFGYYLLVAYAQKPPLPLSALASGSGDVLPDVLRVSAGPTTDLSSTYDVANPGRLELGQLDVAFVIIFLLPLAILAVGHGALATEREEGQLPILAVHGLSARQVACTRLGMRAGLVVLLGILTPLIALAIGLGTTPEPRALLAWSALVVGYGAFWAGLTLLATTLARAGETVAALIGAAWVLLVLVLPWAIALGSELAYPPPPRVQQILAGRAATDEAQAGQAAALGRYLLDHPEFGLTASSAAADEYTKAQIAAAAAVDARQVASDRTFEPAIAARRRAVDRLAWLAPPLLAAQAMTGLGGNDLARHATFAAQTRAYVDELRGYFAPRALRGDADFHDWFGWPRYRWREPSRGPAIARAFGSAGGLLVAAAVLTAIALVRLGRVKPGRRRE